MRDHVHASVDVVHRDVLKHVHVVAIVVQQCFVRKYEV